MKQLEFDGDLTRGGKMWRSSRFSFCFEANKIPQNHWENLRSSTESITSYMILKWMGYKFQGQIRLGSRSSSFD